MTQPDERLEARVAAALRSEAEGVLPGPGSLDAIRRRGRAARRRRRAVLAGAGAAVLATVAVAVPLLDRDEPTVTTGPDGQPTTTTTEPPAVMTDPTPELGHPDDAMWPDPSGELFTDPVEAARSFVEVVVGVDDPPLSVFRSGTPGPERVGPGEVDVFARGEDGGALDRVVSTLQLRELEEHWFVVAAESADVQIDTPVPLAPVASPVPVTGEGRGFEGTILVEMRARSAGAEAFADAVAAGGAGAEPEPFAAELVADAPAAPVAVLVARNTTGVAQGVPAFAARPVRFEGPVNAPDRAPDEQAETGGAEPRGESAYEFPQVPLWPFPDQEAADNWLASGGGSSPWHADAVATAQFFTMNHLGFAEIDRVTSEDIGADEAWVGVGYTTETGQAATSALIHLRRFGPDQDAPWEVVGTRDTDLVLDTPRYGSSVGTPATVTVGGTVTGVDESLRVTVLQQSEPMVIGEDCCLPAGGEDERWETTVAVGGATDEAATIVVSTGGHVQEVERFAITGIRP